VAALSVSGFMLEILKAGIFFVVVFFLVARVTPMPQSVYCVENTSKHHFSKCEDAS